MVDEQYKRVEEAYERGVFLLKVSLSFSRSCPLRSFPSLAFSSGRHFGDFVGFVLVLRKLGCAVFKIVQAGEFVILVSLSSAI